MEVMRHASTFLRPPPLPPAADGPAPSYALVVLNQRLPRFAPDLWSHATLRIFADGGANRVFDGMPKFFPEQDPLEVRRRYKPDVIRGDLDSIRPEVKEFYSNLGVKVEDVSYDQDTTDLHKCVAFICDFTPEVDKPNKFEQFIQLRLNTAQVLSDPLSVGGTVLTLKTHWFTKLGGIFNRGIEDVMCRNNGSRSCDLVLCILVAGALGGRFDHEAGNLNILYKFSNIRIVLLSDDCLIQLLPKTHCHEIHIQSSVEGPHCGLIPVGAPSVSTTTTGLRWDLTDAGMSFGGLISTSNMVCKERITVRSDSDLLWTISIKKKT